MKKKISKIGIVLSIFCIVSTFSFASCSKDKEEAITGDNLSSIQASNNQNEISIVPTNVFSDAKIPIANNDSVDNRNKNIVDEIKGLSEDNQAESDRVELTEQEIIYFTDLLNQNDNQGFLTCEYDSPDMVDLNEVLYGAPSDCEPASDVDENLSFTDDGDLFMYTTSFINDLLHSKMGISLDEVKIRLEYPYLPEDDAYYLEIYDTNRVSITAVEGYKDSSNVTIIYTTGNEDGNWKVTLKKSRESYSFVSNLYFAKRKADLDQVYHLVEPDFLDLKDISICKVAKDYIDLSDEEFDKKYTAESLWKLGVFDRLLFTENTKENVIGDMGIGSSLQEVIDTFGDSQFGTADILQQNSGNYPSYLLFGYKTKAFYFAFQIDPDTKLIKTICLRKRYQLPEECKDMLAVLAQYDDWYCNSDFNEGQVNKKFDNDRVEYTQWGRGTLTMICDYGFTSTSGMGVSYKVYGDFTGDIPMLSAKKDEWTGEDYEPVTVANMDYPERMIYNIYSYLAEQSDVLKNEKGIVSPDGRVFVYEVDADWLDMTRSSGLYETAHVVLHWLDTSEPDRLEYFGHYSTVIGFIGNRYIVESDMFGLHVLDMESDQLVYYEEDTVDGMTDLQINNKKSEICDSNGNVQYSYKFDANGDIIVRKKAN